MPKISHALPGEPVRLDAKDKQILSWLSVDCRMPFTRLAKAVRLSHDSVRYRVKRLEEKGVIRGYRALVNAACMGFDAYHVLLSLRQPSPSDEKAMVSSFEANPNVRAVIKFSGAYDYKVATVARDVQELDRIVNGVLAACKNAVQSHEILMIVKTVVTRPFPKSLQVASAQPDRLPEHAHCQFDEVDSRILASIANDARKPLGALAIDAKISADAAGYRLKRLKSQGIIMMFRPVIDYAALGYSFYCLLVSVQNLTPEKDARLVEVLSDDQNTIWGAKTVGRYNVMMYVVVRRPEELHATIDKLRGSFPGDITSFQALLAYEEFKFTYFSEAMWRFR